MEMACRESYVGVDLSINDGPLFAALFSGALETPRWGTFLDELRRETQADYAILMFRPPRRRVDESVYLLSGAEPSAVADIHAKYSAYVERPENRALSEGKPYTLAELRSADGEIGREFFNELVDRRGVSAVLQMRVREASGIHAWLTIARHGEDFGEHDDALLRSIAPTLRGVLQLYVAMERERYAASLTADAVRRLQFGWLTLDNQGQVLDCDEQGALVLAHSKVLGRSPSGKLAATPAGLKREIYAALARVTQNPRARPRAITLNHDPWLDMLLSPARGKSLSAQGNPAAIAYVHGDNWRSTDRCEQLAELFGLSPREAKLALALSRGMTLAEAASEFGLTINTARTYSRAIYAKSGARGLPDLVRIVMRSVLAIAP
jgi:DNA-binding CsgD family transcriptional regulator